MSVNVRERRNWLPERLYPFEDPAFGDAERRRWEQLFADHRTVELRNAGHYIQEEAPQEIVNAIREWR